VGEVGDRLSGILPGRRLNYQILSIVETKYVARNTTAITIPIVSVFISRPPSIRVRQHQSTLLTKPKALWNQQHRWCLRRCDTVLHAVIHKLCFAAKPRAPNKAGNTTFSAANGRTFIGGKVMLVSKELNAAYWSLRIAFGLGPLIAGLDKFANLLVNWEKYLSPTVQRMLPFRAVTFMQIVGGIEIVVGLAILLGASRVFGYMAMLWLWAIAANLISTGTYYDIAVRDILLGMGAYALARVTEARHSIVYVDVRDEYRRTA
jgi:uncharacterized membrane protein YphA (DoxX/SURF4 family)